MSLTDWITFMIYCMFTFTNLSSPLQAPIPLRVTRVVTAVLPSSLVARRVSVEDPPAELDTPLPEQVPLEVQQRLAEQNKKLLHKPSRRLLLESPDTNQPTKEMHQDQPVRRTSRQQHLGVSRVSMKDSHYEMSRAESTETSSNKGNGDENLVRKRRNLFGLYLILLSPLLLLKE